MSWAGALGGLGRSVQSIANRYIDEELAQKRAEFLQSLQLEGEKKREEYQQSDEVQGRRNANAAKSTLAQRAAERQAVVAGANDAGYQGALDTASQLEATRKGQATATQLGIETPAKVASANQVEVGTRDERLTTQRGLTDIQTSGQIKVVGAQRAAKDADDPLAKIKPADRERLAGISAELSKIDGELVKAKAADGGWAPDRNPGQQELMERRQMLSMQRNAILSRYEGGGSDPLGIRGQPAPGGAEQPADDKPKGLPRIKDGEKRSEPPKSHDQLFAEGIKSADDRQLKRWASIKGHTHQQAAKEELARRQREWDEAAADQPSGIGFGTFGGP